MSVTSETLRLLDGLRRQLAGITDQQTRDLVAAWATAWNEIASDLFDALLDLAANADQGVVSRAQVLRSGRLLNALAAIHTQLDTLATQAGVRITADLQTIVDDAGRAQAAIVDSQLPAYERERLADWDRVDPAQIAAIVRRSTGQITSLTRPLSAQASAAVRAELIRGIAAGTNPRQTAARMLQATEGKFNGGLTRALVISRTESLDAHRAAAALSMQANADVLAGWKWLATLDVRTCPACWAENGTVHDLTEPGPLGHQQCRCSRAPVTKSWADLGFDGLTEPPSVFPDSQARFANLALADQRAILGPSRFEAWSNGHFPIDRWSVRRDNPGWRPAYYTAPVSGGLLARRVAS